MGTEPSLFVGVDVGGAQKGFHAISIRDKAVVRCFHTRDAVEIRDWCAEIKAYGVAVDAPCRWSSTGRARPAERALAKAGMFTFATPSESVAKSKPFYQWMLNGARLYQLIEEDRRLFDGTLPNGPFCVETFPQAVACALAGKVVSAKKKRTVRISVLQRIGFDTSMLTNIDYVDAALCAVAANHVAMGSYTSYGDKINGFIVTPATR